MSLAELFYCREAIRTRVKRWHSKKRLSSRQQFTLEALEPRVLLSATPTEVFANQALEPAAITVPAGSLPSLDVDLNGQADALSDGIVIIRHLFGFTGNALVDGAVDPAGQRTDPTAIATYLESIRNTALDVDLNGGADALSDGIVIIRSLFGFTGTALTDGVVDPAGQRIDPAAIAAFLDNMNPQRELIAPALSVGLQQDTGLSVTDTITFNPTITGSIADISQIVSFVGGFDDVPVGSFVDMLDDLQPTGTFTLSTSRLTQIAGGTLADGSHTLHLQAIDARGNVAMLDHSFLLDTTAPTVSAGMNAVALGSGTVTVSWDAASDAIGLSAYAVERSIGGGPFFQIAVIGGLSYGDTGLTPGTVYSYRVQAVDLAGNLSGPSLVATATTPTAAAGPVAAYGFGEGSGETAADGSGHGMGGTLTNGPSWTAGRYGNGLTFDGVDDYVDLGNPTALQLTGSMTLSGWINASSFPSDDAAVLSKRASDDIGFQLDVTKDTGPRTIGFKLTDSSGGQMWRYGVTTLQPDTWYYIAGVYDAETQSLHVYLNGQLDDGALQGTVTASQLDSTANVNIGRRAGATGYEFAGRIDDVRIYDRVLTAAEIQTDMRTSVGMIGSADPNPPDVHLDQPAEGALVSDIVVVVAHATDDVGVAGVQFFVDGVPTGLLDTVAPYALTWDTRTLSNGAHTLTAQADDTGGNSALSLPVAVNVSNTSYFQNEILASGFNLPTAIKFLPDGRLLVAELEGTIEVLPAPYIDPDPTPFLQLTNVGSAGVQQGIYDIAVDPNFDSNHYYYVFYTLGTPNRDRLSRFTADASLTGTVAGSEVVLYQDPEDANAEHHGGSINFGNDGTIYFTTGEHFTAAAAQLLTSPRGKVHRINPDGTVPTDNPFYDGAGPNWDSIWALGLRNPYRAYYDAPTGRLLIGDVGGNDYSTAMEEVNVGVRGANYGWPDVEGISSDPAYTNPIYAYAHNGRDASITGGFVYHGSQFPSSYQGSYFFADYTQNWIRRLTFDADGNVSGVLNFEPVDGSVDGPYGDIVYLTEGPDGALYYVDLGYSDIGGAFGVSQIRRVHYIQSDLPPVVAASATPREGVEPLTVNFSGAGSSDPEGLPLTYLWAFGDGLTSTASDPQHTYANAGLYQARLTVSDGVNATFSTPISISAGNKPVATLLTAPSNGEFFRAGDVISYSAQATDIEDGQLPASAFTWNIDFLHEGHVHPGIAITGVTGGSFEIPKSGHDFSGFTRYRITLTVTDSDGLHSVQSAIVFPDKVDLTFDTAPGGLILYVDGIAHTAPFVYDTLVGFDHTIEARDQIGATSPYTFTSWSDGGAQNHQIIVPDSNQSYVATFQETTPAAAGVGSEAVTTTIALLTAPSVLDDGVLTPVVLPSETVWDLGNADTWSAQPGDILTRLDDVRRRGRFDDLTGEGMTVVVIDTGIDVDHPFFGPDADHNGVADRIVFQYDFADYDTDASDRSGHGSHIASLIGSEDLTHPGVAPEADLIALKVFSDSGTGTFAYVEQALQWVVAHAADYSIDVVNLSLGDGQNWTTPGSHYGLGDEFATLANDGIIVVAAAGNNFFTASSRPGVAYPAADPNVIGVGAVWTADFGGPWRWSSGAIDLTTGADRITSFSQRDATMTEIFAPGARLAGANQSGGTVTMQGTSQAAAYLSGTALLAQEVAEHDLGRKLTPQEFTDLVVATGKKIVDGDDEQDNVMNTGLTFPRVDMLQLAKGIHRYAALERGEEGHHHSEHGFALAYAQRCWVKDFVNGSVATLADNDPDEELVIALPVGV